MSPTNTYNDKDIKVQGSDRGDPEAMIQQVLDEMALQREMFESAFPLNDRGKPDYSAHYQQHVKMTREENDMSEYKKAITLRLLQGAVGLILTFIGFGLLPALRDFVATVSK